MRYFKVLVIALLLTFFVPIRSALAISNPDSMILDNIQAYQGVVESGDMLFVMSYQINYTVNPSETATEAFMLRMMDGSTEISSVQPFAYVDDGYSGGVFSLYFSAAEVQLIGLIWEDSYTFRLQGNPNVFAVPPVIENSSINWTSSLVTKSALKNQVTNLALGLEFAWIDFTDPDIDLLYSTPEGNAFTAEGEFYFTNVIPNLRLTVPSLFIGRTSIPTNPDRTFTLSYRDQLAEFWNNSSIGTALDNTAAVLSTPRMLLTTLCMVAFNGVIVFALLRANPAAGPMIPLTIAIIFPVGALVGLTDLLFASLLAVFAILGTVFILYLRRG